ncbi:hypothetical protein Tco_0603679 [Tanacetum coccineum]
MPSPSVSTFSFPSTTEPVFSVSTSEPVFESPNHSQTSQTTQSQQLQQYHTTTVSNNNAKFPYLKRLYDIGCYNDNLALMLAPESDETILLAQESRSKLNPFIQNTIEGNFCPQIRRTNADLEKFHLCLKEKMVADLRYFNSLEHEVDSLKSQLKTQKTQFLNEIDRLSREYYYADHMNAILGVYTNLDEFTDLQCDYMDQVVKWERLEKELSKSNITSKSFTALQQHAIDLELAIQQCQEQRKNDKAFKENKSKVFLKEREHYFEIQDLKAQLQDKGIAISELKKLIEKMKGKYVETKFEKPLVIRQPNAFKIQIVIPTTSASRPRLKSNRLEDRAMHNNSEGKKQQVEDHLSREILFIVDLGFSKHMTEKFMLSIVTLWEHFIRYVKFGNIKLPPILVMEICSKEQKSLLRRRVES